MQGSATRVLTLLSRSQGKYAANMERFRRTSYNGTSFEPFMEHIPRCAIHV